MIVSVSGPVGSGKTTVADRAADLLRAAGHRATVVRFQSLPCFGWLRSSLKPPSPARRRAPAAPGDVHIRWQGYRQKRLDSTRMLIYLARIIAFRIYILRWKRQEIFVLNRYFYDLFSHYRLRGRAEQIYVRILRAMMPVPDVAILVEASERTLAIRRPDYAPEYLASMTAAYASLRAWFPELQELRSDQIDGLEGLEELLRDLR
jgi:thymidylate kinase